MTQIGRRVGEIGLSARIIVYHGILSIDTYMSRPSQEGLIGLAYSKHVHLINPYTYQVYLHIQNSYQEWFSVYFLVK